MDSKYTITKCVPSSADMDFMEDRIYEHNSTRTGRTDGALFGFFIRGEGGVITAGCTGWTWAGACEITTLWVHPSLRGQGIGKELLASAEAEATAKGCEVILLSSYDFQAPPFYQKMGYELIFKLEDFPPGHRNNYLIKRLPKTKTGS